ncbi:LemA family protein [Actinoplanes sp. NPDC051470]|uniref:LemA family protein n=1 Tax=unclassified Actinoplanes TaxID=2626549 RepID=UPI003447E6B7
MAFSARGEVIQSFVVSMGSVFTAVCGVALLLALLVTGWAVAVFNRFVRSRNQVDASWGQIDVQLRRRYDLIPNLVATVQGYASHERGTLDAVVAARGLAVGAAQGAPMRDRAQAEGELTHMLGRLFALAENYPDLKANHNFARLQSELAATEDKIAYARQFFNSATESYNNAVQTMPASIVATVAGFGTRDFFHAAESERGPVQVRF